MTTVSRLLPIAARLLASAALICSLGLAKAQVTEDEPTRFLFSSFGSLGASQTSTNFGGGFARDVSQVPGVTGLQMRPDTRVGAQLNWRATDALEAVGQLVLRDRPAEARAADALEWAFVAYRPSSDTTVRAGRLSADLYLLSDFRNVGYGYLPARPATDFYGVMSLSNLDGADVSHTWRSGDADWRIKAALGKARYDVVGQRAQFNDVRELVLTRESEGLTVRATLAQARLGLRLPNLATLRQGLDVLALAPVSSVAAQAAALSSALNFENIRVRYTALGFAYDRNNWVINAEWMRITTATSALTGSGAYVLAGRRFGAFTPYVGLSRSRSLNAPATTPAWGAALAPLAPIIGTNTVAQAQALGEIATSVYNTYRSNTTTQTLGVRWDIQANLSLKAQWDWVKVRPLGGVLWGGQPGGGKATVGSLVLDFVY